MKNSHKWTIEIPYGARNDYIDFVCQINQYADKEDGIVSLFVCNNPYAGLHSHLVVESNDNQDKIAALIDSNNLRLDNEIGFMELLQELANRKYNQHVFSGVEDRQAVQNAFSLLFEFADERLLKERGYSIKPKIKRKKLFISYCHKDKSVVYNIVDELEKSGANLWIDKKDITVGDNILETVLNGINESDLAILFLSLATIESKFSKLELRTVMNAMIKKNKGWYLVKLDKINVDDILPSLSDYLYFDYTNNTLELVNDIMKKVNALS